MLFACWPLDDGVDVEVGAKEAMVDDGLEIFVKTTPGDAILFCFPLHDNCTLYSLVNIQPIGI